jgi:hypothetical protein
MFRLHEETQGRQAARRVARPIGEKKSWARGGGDMVAAADFEDLAVGGAADGSGPGHRESQGARHGLESSSACW